MEIYVYGTGCGAGELTREALSPERIAAFVESEPTRETFLGRSVISVSAMAERNVDLLIVTAKDSPAFSLPAEKVLYLKNHLALCDRNRAYDTARKALGDAFVDRLRRQEALVRAPLWDDGSFAPSGDWVRMKTLEAVCRELGGVPGAMAELGVFRGEFAAAMNALLPERTLYLFDTFEGFSERDAEVDRDRKFSGASFDFSGTSVELVLSKMEHPENCVIRKGWFPDTAEGVDDKFCLVSIDADLYQPILAGLEFFYPRLSHGGAIMVHDFNNEGYSGARQAVKEFCDKNSAGYVCLPDDGGSVVIAK